MSRGCRTQNHHRQCDADDDGELRLLPPSWVNGSLCAHEAYLMLLRCFRLFSLLCCILVAYAARCSFSLTRTLFLCHFTARPYIYDFLSLDCTIHCLHLVPCTCVYIFILECQLFVSLVESFEALLVAWVALLFKLAALFLWIHRIFVSSAAGSVSGFEFLQF